MSCKNIIIIGNACSVLKKENGHKIDNFDYIVRMGDMPRIQGYEKYIGSRTDMLRLKWFNLFCAEQGVDDLSVGDIRNDIDISFKDLLFTFQDCDQFSEITEPIQRYYNISLNRSFMQPIGNRYIHDFYSNFFKFLNKNIYFFNSCDFESLCYELFKNTNIDLHKKWVEPSGGLCTIWFFLQNYQNNNIFITGFDGFKTGHYWKPGVNTNFSSHNGVLEQILIKKLINKGYINEL